MNGEGGAQPLEIPGIEALVDLLLLQGQLVYVLVEAVHASVVH